MGRYTIYIKYVSRLMAVLIVVAMVGMCLPAASAAEASGQCGVSLTWSFSGDTLVISGSGAMWDFPEDTMAPWYDYRYQIAAVQLPEGLTRIGDLAFYDCPYLTSVTIPASVTQIGWHAFDGCTGMTMLTFSSNLRVIEDAAFKDCTALKAVRLPQSLNVLGFQAFYRCASLTEITIPASVTDMGMTTFAFCFSLVRADVQAPVTKLPDWTFYGCTLLTDLTLPATMTGANAYAFYDCTGLQNVEYSGPAENLTQIRSDIDRDLDISAGLITVGDVPNGDTSTGTVFEETEDGIVSNTSTTTKTENTTISHDVTVTYPNDGTDGSSTEIQVDVTVENNAGWQDVADYLEENLSSGTAADINVYVKDNSEVPAEILNSLAGEDIRITVHTASGSSWQVDCSAMAPVTQENPFGFNYQRTDATAEELALLGSTVGYRIQFDRDAQINAKVMIRLPSEYARDTATFFQMEGNGVEQLQSVMVDAEGYAHFYLGAVDRETVYLIGINARNVTSDAVIVPDSLLVEFGIGGTTDDVEYVITGRTSSWNMSLGQVTGIMVGVMAACIVGIGVFMYAMNKRKLKLGYVPELDDDGE